MTDARLSELKSLLYGRVYSTVGVLRFAQESNGGMGAIISEVEELITEVKELTTEVKELIAEVEQLRKESSELGCPNCSQATCCCT